MRTQEKFLSILIEPFRPLNKQPIIVKTQKFHLVYFGLFMVFSFFASSSLMVYYLAAKGIQFTLHPIIAIGIMLFFMLFCTKFFHIFVVGLDYFKRPLYYMNQTVMYNQGGLFGVAIGVLILSYLENIRLNILFDALIFGSTLGLFIGRLACYNYGCCYGQPTESSFNVKYKNPNSKVLRVHPELKNVPLHPTQLIAALFNLLLFIITLVYTRYFNQDGIITIGFLLMYNLFRYLSQQKRASAKIKIISNTAIFYFLLGVFILGLSFFLGKTFYSITVFKNNLTAVGYFKFLWKNKELLQSLGILSIITFLFYGLHGKKLGVYFGE